MKIKAMFDDVYEIDITSILNKYGVDDVEEYLKGNTVEPTTNYDNIDEWCEVLNKYIESNKTIYVLIDSDMDGPYRDWETDRKSTRLNSSHITRSRMPSSA